MRYFIELNKFIKKKKVQLVSGYSGNKQLFNEHRPLAQYGLLKYKYLSFPIFSRVNMIISKLGVLC